MRMPLSVSRRATLLGRVFCLLAAVALAGCASKNPLMEEPVAAAKPDAKSTVGTPPVPAATTATASAPAATVAASNQTPAAAKTADAAPVKSNGTSNSNAQTSGVQTSGSRGLFGFISPYRIDVQQGNFISREMVTQLKPGMTPEQVRFALGTPLLTDMFHANRWDYVFRLKKGNGQILASKVTVFFKDQRLERIDGGSDLPLEKDYLTLIAGTPATSK